MGNSDTGRSVLDSIGSSGGTPLRRGFELKLRKENELAFQELREDPE